MAPRLAESLRRYDTALLEANGRAVEELVGAFTPAGVADALLQRGARRGTATRNGAPVSIEIVDDDQGGRWPASPSSFLAEALHEGKLLAPPDAEAPFKVLMALAEPRASKGRAGFSAENRARLANLAPKADLVVLFGHPRLLKEIPGDRPALVAWHRQKLMQEGVARWLVALK